MDGSPQQTQESPQEAPSSVRRIFKALRSGLGYLRGSTPSAGAGGAAVTPARFANAGGSAARTPGASPQPQHAPSPVHAHAAPSDRVQASAREATPPQPQQAPQPALSFGAWASPGAPGGGQARSSEAVSPLTTAPPFSTYAAPPPPQPHAALGSPFGANPYAAARGVLKRARERQQSMLGAHSLLRPEPAAAGEDSLLGPKRARTGGAAAWGAAGWTPMVNASQPPPPPAQAPAPSHRTPLLSARRPAPTPQHGGQMLPEAFSAATPPPATAGWGGFPGAPASEGPREALTPSFGQQETQQAQLNATASRIMAVLDSLTPELRQLAALSPAVTPRLDVGGAGGAAPQASGGFYGHAPPAPPTQWQDTPSLSPAPFPPPPPAAPVFASPALAPAPTPAAPASSPGGWGADFLALNAAASKKATDAAAAEAAGSRYVAPEPQRTPPAAAAAAPPPAPPAAQPPAPAPAASGWPAGFMEKNAVAARAASDAAALAASGVDIVVGAPPPAPNAAAAATPAGGFSFAPGGGFVFNAAPAQPPAPAPAPWPAPAPAQSPAPVPAPAPVPSPAPSPSAPPPPQPARASQPSSSAYKFTGGGTSDWKLPPVAAGRTFSFSPSVDEAESASFGAAGTGSPYSFKRPAAAH